MVLFVTLTPVLRIDKPNKYYEKSKNRDENTDLSKKKQNKRVDKGGPRAERNCNLEIPLSYIPPRDLHGSRLRNKKNCRLWSYRFRLVLYSVESISDFS